MDNELQPKQDEQQDKHEQAKASLEDLQRMMAEFHEKHPELDEEITESDAVEQEENEVQSDEPSLPEEKEVEQTEVTPVQEVDKAEQPAEPEKVEETDKTEQPAEKEPKQKKAVVSEEKKPAEDVQAEAEQKQREELLNKQARRKHPDQPLATMKVNRSAQDKKSASGGKKSAVKKSANSRRAAARRRKKRLMRLGATVVVLLVLIVVVVSVVRGLGGDGNRKLSGGGSGSGDTTNVTSQVKEQEDTSKPASQRESKQYKKIKDDTSLPAYALEYPGMYSDAVSEPNVESDEKVCYLTFDDGPSSTNTPGILDALKQANVKATFFVITSEIDGNEDIIKRIVDEGHTLCIHANEHVYGDLYSSVEGYLKDFSEAYDKIYAITGYRVQGFRFPGGSNNAVMQRHNTYDAIVGEMTRRGFEYYDWNAYDHDAENGDYSVEQMVNYAIDEVTSSSRNDTVLLMHDTYGKEKTVQALPSIISRLKEVGIEMLPITNSSRPVHFEVNENTPSDLPQPETDDTDDASDTDTGTDAEDTEA